MSPQFSVYHLTIPSLGMSPHTIAGIIQSESFQTQVTIMTQKPTTHLLPCLPTELLAKVMTKLDCIAVKNLMLAYPEISVCAVLVTEKELLHEPPKFFTIPGLTRYCVEDMKLGGAGRSDAVIKLFEISGDYDRSGVLSAGGVDVLDARSCLYQYGKVDELFTSKTELREGLSLKGEKRMWGWDLSLTRERLDTQRPPLRSLELTISGCLQGLHAPDLERLIINSFAASTTTTPEISHLNLPNIKDLQVYFSGPPPHIHDITIGTEKSLRSFGIHHIGGLDPYAPPVRTTLPSTNNSSTRPVIDFDISGFTALTLCGVPNCFGGEMHTNQLQNLQSLCIMDTVEYNGNEGVNLKHPSFFIPGLKSFVYINSLNLNTVPEIAGHPQLDILKVLTTAPGLKLGSILQPRPGFNTRLTMKTLEIVCDLPFRFTGFHDNHIVFSDQEVEDIRIAYGIRKLVIHGCLFGQDNRCHQLEYRYIYNPSAFCDTLRFISMKIIRTLSLPRLCSDLAHPFVICGVDLFKYQNLRNVEFFSIEQMYNPVLTFFGALHWRQAFVYCPLTGLDNDVRTRLSKFLRVNWNYDGSVSASCDLICATRLLG